MDMIISHLRSVTAELFPSPTCLQTWNQVLLWTLAAIPHLLGRQKQMCSSSSARRGGGQGIFWHICLSAHQVSLSCSVAVGLSSVQSKSFNVIRPCLEKSSRERLCHSSGAWPIWVTALPNYDKTVGFGVVDRLCPSEHTFTHNLQSLQPIMWHLLWLLTVQHHRMHSGHF